jgi:hypothetical protein
MTANGYVEIMIQGKRIGLKFNMYAFEQYETIKGKAGNIKNFTTVIWIGYLGNCYAKQIEPDLTFEQISDWVDESMANNEQEQLTRISEVFLNSQVLKGLISQGGNGDPDQELKKKITELAG